MIYFISRKIYHGDPRVIKRGLLRMMRRKCNC